MLPMDFRELKEKLCQQLDADECLVVRVESNTALSTTMYLFQLFQNGLIFVALSSGLANICHLAYCRTSKCRNTTFIFLLLLIGFSHMLTCVYLLQISENSTVPKNPDVPNQKGCLDYYIPAILANTCVFAIIILNIIKENWSTRIGSGLMGIISLGFVILGLSGVLQDTDLETLDPNEQGSIMTFGSKSKTHLDVFWSVCQTQLSDEKNRLLCEYGLIHLPFIVVVLAAWYKTRDATKGEFMNLRVISNDQCEAECGQCDCAKLNTAFIAILVYSAVILLLARPLMVLYSHATSDYFRDVLPSLLQTVLYCFLCSEYFSRLISTKAVVRDRACTTDNHKVALYHV